MRDEALFGKRQRPLTALQRNVLRTLRRLANGGTSLRISNAALARRMGLHEYSVLRATCALEDADHITVIRTGNRTPNTFVFKKAALT